MKNMEMEDIQEMVMEMEEIQKVQMVKETQKVQMVEDQVVQEKKKLKKSQ